jgi:hypothetical protein
MGAILLLLFLWYALFRCLQMRENRTELREARNILRHGKTMFKSPRSLARSSMATRTSNNNITAASSSV